MRSTTKRRTSLTKFVLLFAAGGLLLTLPPARPACAHFLWLATEGDGKVPAVRAFLSETPAPDLPEFLKTIASAKMSAGGRPLGWTKGEETYHVSLPTPLPKVIDGVCDLGVMTRKGATFRLVYTARVQLGPPPPAVEGAATDDLRLALLARSGETPVVAVTFRGRPLPGATIKVFPEDGEPIELKSDKAGELVVPDLAKGRAGVLAKWVEAQPGELEGKVYREARYYATLTVGPNVSGADPAPAVAEPFAELIEPVNSFGGALSGDWLYVYSGHVEGTHRYHEGATSRHFRRLNLKDRTRWEELPPGPSLQGVSLVAHGGKLYRVGGMVAKNRPSEPDDLVSVADFAVYDPATATWADLAPLPSPRSTHDAVVIGDKLYVVGGWSLPGGDAAHGEFHKDALVYDLSRPVGRWETLPPPPFRRRALAAASHAGTLVVLGGLTEIGGVVKTVDFYDPARRTWSRGPDLRGSRLEGFAPSAFEVGGRVYVSGRDGVVRRLNAAGDAWEDVSKLAVPRLTHRLLPGIANDVLAVGGNSAGKPVRLVESVPVGGPRVTPGG